MDNDRPGACLGVVGWPSSGTTSFALMVARHARWRGHFDGGVFFIPIGDIAAAVTLEELPDGPALASSEIEAFEAEGEL